MSLIWTQDMRPEPNELIEQRVRQMLQSIDALLDIRWFPNAVYNERHKDYEGRYGLTVRWAQADPRWQLYRSGEIGEPVDLLGWFAADMQDANSRAVSPESIETRVLELLASADNERTPWKKRMQQTVEHNRKVRADNHRVLDDMVTDEAAYQFNRVKNMPIVAVTKDIR